MEKELKGVQTINDDLNASLATADELSREFNSLLKEVSPSNNSTTSASQLSNTSITTRESSGSSNVSFSSTPFSSSSTSLRPMDSGLSTSIISPASPVFSTNPLSSPKINVEPLSPLARAGSDSYSYNQRSPRHSPQTARRNPLSGYDRSPRGSASYMDRSPSMIPPPVSFDHASRSAYSSNLLSPYDSIQAGRRSPRPDRSPSPLPSNYPVSNTLPRNFGFRQPEGVQRQKSPGKWNETDLDMSYERKPHHTYDSWSFSFILELPNSGWRESNLDGPPPAPSHRKVGGFSHSSLPRNTRITIPPDVSSSDHSPYYPQPIISRISIPPTSSQSHQRRPIPLSVIMRLQNPQWGANSTLPPRVLGGEGDMASYQPAVPIPREFFRQPVLQPQQNPPEQRQPTIYSDGDIDAELERLDYDPHMPVILENPSMPEGGKEIEQDMSPASRPLSPTRLQPVVALEAQTEQIPDLEEVLRIRAEIPRALKRRGSVDQSQPLKKASHYQPNQYKIIIGKLFHRKNNPQRVEQGSETSSSSDGEDSSCLSLQGYHSILRRSKQERKRSKAHARLSPHVLLLDGALVGELETVQRALQEMSDPSQPNDEGITALHNAICGGHYNVVDFLVRAGANVSAPDSHGWTPLHCAASCNDRPLCEFLVRNGAAVMAVTESDGATAQKKCDPFADGFEECDSFLRGVEEAMGVENSGVLYALWSYPAQAADELGFKEGDMVTILQKPEGSDWWWASLCGKEGFVPKNYFGLFPKVRPKSLC
uniref:SH3 domain-containing protein n=1 Tax=Monopterus albus TaxID=43700 RepID=A0A3Q3J9E9_MONAL